MQHAISDTIIVFGSSNSKGKTFEAVRTFQRFYENTDYLDLADYNITDFDYNYANKNDDFLPLINKILTYKTIILATPIYWYTMSAIMKRFVDRITDLLHFKEDLLPLLRAKQFAVFCSYGTYPDGKNGFEKIFINISKYLEIKYISCCFYYTNTDDLGLAENSIELTQFINQLKLNK